MTELRNRMIADMKLHGLTPENQKVLEASPSDPQPLPSSLSESDNRQSKCAAVRCSGVLSGVVKDYVACALPPRLKRGRRP